MFVAQTYAKNLGLAGERVGCLSVITSDPEEAKNVHSQLNRIARALWSDPPLFGGRITSLILNDPELKKLWFEVYYLHSFQMDINYILQTGSG